MTKPDGENLIELIGLEKGPLYIHQEIRRIKLKEDDPTLYFKDNPKKRENEKLNERSNDVYLLVRSPSSINTRQSNHAILILLSYYLLLLLFV